ncbi:hypothetical protein K1719_034832 [Acacia pycnantha]|nr:hypothetical protein K1719_034832 [Acacia pycnantha]
MSFTIHDCICRKATASSPLPPYLISNGAFLEVEHVPRRAAEGWRVVGKKGFVGKEGAAISVEVQNGGMLLKDPQIQEATGGSEHSAKTQNPLRSGLVGSDEEGEAHSGIMKLMEESQSVGCEVDTRLVVSIGEGVESDVADIEVKDKDSQEQPVAHVEVFKVGSIMGEGVVGWLRQVRAPGAANADLGRHLRFLISKYHIKLLVLVETKTSGEKCLKLRRKIGFDSSFVEEAQGFSGGIWVLWKSQDVQVDVPADDENVGLDMKVVKTVQCGEVQCGMEGSSIC